MLIFDILIVGDVALPRSPLAMGPEIEPRLGHACG